MSTLLSSSTAKRFWKKVQKTDNCWNWTASTFSHRYGCFGLDGKVVGAHRVSWALSNQQAELPTSFVLHTCDNPRCVRPEHLFLGTAAENMKNMVEKKRGRHPPILINNAMASRLLERYENGESLSSLAREIGRSRDCISCAIIRLKTGESARSIKQGRRLERGLQ